MRLDRRLLDDHQEIELLKRLDIMAAKRLYPTPTILRNMAQEIVGQIPGKKWAAGFVKRHGDKITVIRVEGMEKSRHTAEYRPVFEDYFDLVHVAVCP